MIICPLCKKSFTSNYGLKDHFLKRKNPCIKDKNKWEKEKLKYLPSTPKQITFDKYQKEFIESELDDGKLLGVPGGGKTRCIVEKIEKLFEMIRWSENMFGIFREKQHRKIVWTFFLKTK